MSTGGLLKKWLDSWKKKDDTPPLPPLPLPLPGNKPTSTLYLLFLLWRQKIDPKKWYALFLTVPTIVFLIASGAVAWLAVLVGLFWHLTRVVYSWLS
jgi:hypothetical protein